MLKNSEKNKDQFTVVVESLRDDFKLVIERQDDLADGQKRLEKGYQRLEKGQTALREDVQEIKGEISDIKKIQEEKVSRKEFVALEKRLAH